MIYLHIITYRNVHTSTSLPGYLNSAAKVYGVACE